MFGVSKDIGSSISVLCDWIYYDMECVLDVIYVLVVKYLVCDYWSLVVELEVVDVKFDFLKCVDLYYGKELDVVVK